MADTETLCIMSISGPSSEVTLNTLSQTGSKLAAFRSVQTGIEPPFLLKKYIMRLLLA